ncbi:pilus assembly PilX family protein [Ralstonia sp. UBA689]|uniref:pilus assembly PilX family protein n=1 Tax=Ralstonia sp. UBA689 TaxID=1947373 RepID=UPI0025F4E838|nr:pilus assembly protein [Ralstonia sp. UBA689]
MLNSAGTQARGFSLVIVVTAVALFGLLTMAAFHLMLDQRRRVSLTADHALAKHSAEFALAEAECELSVATDTPATPGCATIPPQDRIAALDPVSLRGFVAGACGSGIALGLCQPLPGQSILALAGLLDETTFGVPIEAPPITPDSERVPALDARYVIEPIPDRWSGQPAQADEMPQPRLFRITAAGFGADPAVNVILQTVFRPRVSNRSASQVTIEAEPPVIRPNGLITQTVRTTLWRIDGDPQHAAETQIQTRKLGRLSWRELIVEGTP